jgi:putative zinc finger/helix-turn-helix YgiT family protein
MTKKVCLICSEGQLVERDGTFETKYVDRRGVERSLTVPGVRRLHCDSCNEEILDDAATRQIENARRAAMGLLTAAEIRDLRSRFGKTQVQMSRLLGIGEKTYCRWESGSFIQSVAFDNYMRLIRDVPEAGVTLTRLEQYGVIETSHTASEEEQEFAFLTDIGSLSEPATKFTQQLVTGTLHTSVEYRV